MTMLDTFMSFAKGLPPSRLEAVEAALAELMASYSDEHMFTQDELAELDRRLADPAPKFADPEEITRLLGKPFAG
jgi:hypothetical protein